MKRILVVFFWGGGCGDMNGKPQIDKTNYLKEAYEFGKRIYSE